MSGWTNEACLTVYRVAWIWDGILFFVKMQFLGQDAGKHVKGTFLKPFVSWSQAFFWPTVKWSSLHVTALSTNMMKERLSAGQDSFVNPESNFDFEQEIQMSFSAGGFWINQSNGGCLQRREHCRIQTPLPERIHGQNGWYLCCIHTNRCLWPDILCNKPGKDCCCNVYNIYALYLGIFSSSTFPDGVWNSPFVQLLKHWLIYVFCHC